MRRFGFPEWVGLAVVVVVVMTMFCEPQDVQGDDRRYLFGSSGVYDRRPDYVQPAQLKLEAQGFVRWCYVHESGRFIKEEARQAFAEWEASTDGAMRFYEDCNTVGYKPDIYVFATSGSGYNYGTANHPGCAFGSVACLPSYGNNINIVIDAGATQTWGLVRDIIAVFLHEDCHAVSDCGEYYSHQTGIGCKVPFVPTVMSCGLGNSRTITLYDVETFAIFYLAPSFARCWIDVAPDGKTPCVGMTVSGNTVGVWWCGRDRRASAVSVAYDGGFWLASKTTAAYADPANLYGDLTNATCQSIELPAVLGRCYWAVQTNGVSFNVREWYQLAGCI